MKNLLMLLAAGSLFVSCAPSTPLTRIRENPEVFARSPAAQKPLVERGEIARGMSKDAVALAWGPPSSLFEASREGIPAERWDYLGSRPIHTTGFYGGIGYGRFGGYGRRYHPYSAYGLGYAPEVTYVPYRRATVWFERGRVQSWERLR